MKCPKDNSELTPIEEVKGGAYFCWECRGIWISKKALKHYAFFEFYN